MELSLESFLKAYRTAGLHPFPLIYGTKEPAVSQGFKSSEDEIRERFEELTKCGIGIACGKSSGNLVVFDFESEEHCWLFFNKTQTLARTLCVKSGHGGVHVYFRTLDECPRRQTKLCAPEHPFDLCGEGGYVVAAPSQIEHKLCDPKKATCPHSGITTYEIISSVRTIEMLSDVEESIRNRCTQLGWTLARFSNALQGLGSFEEVFKQALNKDHELKDLFEGRWETWNHKSRSEAEYRLCSKLVNLCLPDDEIMHVMDACLIGKWQEKTDSYRVRTIRKARLFWSQAMLSKASLLAPQGQEVPAEKAQQEQKKIDPEEEFRKLKSLAAEDSSAKNLASLIMKLHRFATFNDTRDVYVYSEGIYHANGEATIQSLVDRFTDGRSTIKSRSEILDLIRVKTFHNRQEFNGHHELLCLKNGVYNVEKAEFLPHSPDYFFTSRLPVKFDPDAGCHNFWKYLKACQPDPQIRTQLLEAMAYCLDRRPMRRKSYMFLGPKGTGKTTFLNVLRRLIGSENCSAESLQALAGDDKFATSMLYGKMANIYADISDVEIESTGAYKLTTGADLVPAQFKHKPKFYFVPHAKFFFSANHLPKISDRADLAFFDRWFIFYWNIEFVQDPRAPNEKKRIPNLEDQLTTEQELSGLLNLLLYHLKQIRLRGSLLAEPSAEQIKAIWDEKSDFNVQFIKAELKESQNSETSKAFVHQTYRAWCDKKRIAPGSDTALNDSIRQYFGLKIRESRPRGGVRCWQGITTRTEYEEMLRQSLQGSLSAYSEEYKASLPGLPGFGAKEASREAYGSKEKRKAGKAGKGISDYALGRYSSWEEFFR